MMARVARLRFATVAVLAFVLLAAVRLHARCKRMP